MLPYLAVLVLALLGLDVVLVLAIGWLLAGLFGCFMADGHDVLSYANDIYTGCEGMVEITLLSILIGLAALTKAAVDWRGWPPRSRGQHPGYLFMRRAGCASAWRPDSVGGVAGRLVAAVDCRQGLVLLVAGRGRDRFHAVAIAR